MIKAVFFDLDNTLTDFMRMKEMSIVAAVDAMIDAGLKITPELGRERIYAIYDREGIEFQKVFDRFLKEELGHIDHKILAAGIVGYRRVRDSALVLYPHVNLTLIELTKNGIRLMEYIYMDEIARDKVYEFCVFAAPLKFRGGTGSPVRLLALV